MKGSGERDETGGLVGDSVEKSIMWIREQWRCHIRYSLPSPENLPEESQKSSPPNSEWPERESLPQVVNETRAQRSSG